MSGRVVVFEDSDSNYAGLDDAIRPLLSASGCTLERFTSDSIAPPSGKKVDFGELMADFLLTPTETSLVILDFDLTQYLGPVTRGSVQGACTENRIPLAIYHFLMGQDERARYLQRWRENEITLDYSQLISKIGGEAVAILNGFLRIREGLAQAQGKALSELIPLMLQAPPDAEIQIGQYTWGGSRSFDLAEVMSQATSMRYATTLIGYWVYNQLLEFPGVILNATAAAAYLDVDHQTFAEDHRLQDPFARARYKGPFHELGPYWWTTLLNDILAENTPDNAPEVISGYDLLKARHLEVNRSSCLEGHPTTGYYCIINKAPVCEPHSIEPQAWLPVGATRSRILKRTYDSMVPWKIF